MAQKSWKFLQDFPEYGRLCSRTHFLKDQVNPAILADNTVAGLPWLLGPDPSSTQHDRSPKDHINIRINILVLRPNMRGRPEIISDNKSSCLRGFRGPYMRAGVGIKLRCRNSHGHVESSRAITYGEGHGGLVQGLNLGCTGAAKCSILPGSPEVRISPSKKGSYHN